jgi:rubrerythrin
MPSPGSTTSTVMDFAAKLEESSSSFYEKLSSKFTGDKERFLSFAEESKKNRIDITRTYQETITDALEACFCFNDLNLGDYEILLTLGNITTYQDALKQAMKSERTTVEFYSKVAELSEGLLATIPMVFKRIAKKRKNRELILGSLVDNEKV